LVNKGTNFIPHFGSRDVIDHLTNRHQPSISHRYWDICLHYTHTSIVTALDTILASFGGTLGVMPFFGNAPLAAIEGRRVRYEYHNRSTGVDTAVFRQSNW